MVARDMHEPRKSGRRLALIHRSLFVTPWTKAHQAPLSLAFSRQEYYRE